MRTLKPPVLFFVKCFPGFRGNVDSNDDPGNLQSLMIPLYFISLKYSDYMQRDMFYSGKKIIHVFNQNYEKIQNISLITLVFF